MSEQNNELNDNPLLSQTGLPHFDEIRPEHVVPAVRFMLTEAERELSEVEANASGTWDSLMVPLERLDEPFERIWGSVNHLHGVKNSPELREAYNAVQEEVVEFGLRAGQSRPIYDALKAIRDNGEWEKLDQSQRRIVESRLREAELAGIALEGEQQKRFNEIARELSRLSTEFSNHVLDATKAFSLVLTNKAEVDGLPNSLLQLAAHSYNEANAERDDKGEKRAATPEDGPWRITLEAPSVVPFLQHAKRRDLREKVYRAYVTRASDGNLDNTPLIQQILRLRKEQAGILGFTNYAEMSLTRKMAPNAAAIQEMFETLRAASWDPAEQDLNDLQELALQNGHDERLAQWDVGFWAERLREKRFDFTDEELRPYFPLERVLTGLFQLCERLFGVRVEAADGDAPVWDPDVRYFKLFDTSNGEIASFYLDPYSRPKDKRGGAWMNDCLGRRRLDGVLQLPVAHLVCNSTPPTKETPSLMTFREVETLFHEFGHGLQHMLTTVDYPDAAGINGVEWDAVEIASQFMENWCYHKPTLMGVCGHYQTGAPLPDDLFEKLCKARTYRAGSNMLRQLSFGMTDMTLHGDYDPDGSETIFDVQRRIAEKTSVLPLLPEDRFLCSFQHIFAGGYAAGYYSYKWAELLSADAFSAFEDVGLDNEAAVEETGRRFRETILAQGGGRHPMDVFKDFRGREPSPEPLLRHNGLSK